MRHNLIWIASALCVTAAGCRGPGASEVPARQTVAGQPSRPQYTPPPPRSATVAHAAVGKPVTGATTPNPQYEASGVASLVDGRVGSDDYMDLEWMGWWYEDKPFEATIDLGESMPIHELGVHTLTTVESWIFYPRKVEFELSADGKTFEKVATITPAKADFENEMPEDRILKASDLEREARFVRVRVERFGELPKWHGSHGGGDGYEGQAWLFIGEILVNPKK